MRLSSALPYGREIAVPQYGLPSVDPEIDTSLVWKRLRAIQQDIASTDDNPERFEAMGVEVIYGTARLTGPNTVAVLPKPGTDGAERELETRIILLCTGSRPAMPPKSRLSPQDLEVIRAWIDGGALP